MKINFDKVLTDLNGKPLSGGDADTPLSLKLVCVNALMASYQDERDLSGEDKLSRYKLAQKIHAGGEQETTTEEASSVKKLIAKSYGPLVVGQAYEAIES